MRPSRPSVRRGTFLYASGLFQVPYAVGAHADHVVAVAYRVAGGLDPNGGVADDHELTCANGAHEAQGAAAGAPDPSAA
jgi:hypothetical protein